MPWRDCPGGCSHVNNRGMCTVHMPDREVPMPDTPTCALSASRAVSPTVFAAHYLPAASAHTHGGTPHAPHSPQLTHRHPLATVTASASSENDAAPPHAHASCLSAHTAALWAPLRTISSLHASGACECCHQTSAACMVRMADLLEHHCATLWRGHSAQSTLCAYSRCLP